MSPEYLNFICTKDTFSGTFDKTVLPFDAYENYDLITSFYNSCPECQSFPKDVYFEGDWYADWEDYVIWEDGRIAARAGIWKKDRMYWEVAGVITRPEYRNKGYSVSMISYCIARILEQGKIAVLSTAQTNLAMIHAAKKAGFVLQE